MCKDTSVMIGSISAGLKGVETTFLTTVVVGGGARCAKRMMMSVCMLKQNCSDLNGKEPGIRGDMYTHMVDLFAYSRNS